MFQFECNFSTLDTFHFCHCIKITLVDTIRTVDLLSSFLIFNVSKYFRLLQFQWTLKHSSSLKYIIP